MSGIFVHGIGAVSPAGWGIEPMRKALQRKTPIAVTPVLRPGSEKPLHVRAVPPPENRPAFLAHPRLRRSSALAQHVVVAAMEALGEDATRVQKGELRLGAVVTTQIGCVNYSRRFYEEVLKNPATASPLLFPETVFNAPASHLAAYLNSSGVNYTLVGDDGMFAIGLALAAQWLAQDKVELCVVIGAEELDWVVADAVRLFDRSAIYSGGAGAICLRREMNANGAKPIAELKTVTDAFVYTKEQPREMAISKMLEQLAASESGSEVQQIFGSAFNASAAWQCVAACDALRSGEVTNVKVPIVGANEQAIGVEFAVAK